jgi:hypothetical protein
MSAPTIEANATRLAVAVAYAERGLAIIPCGPDKRPLVKWKQYQTEAPSVEQVRAWWSEQFPGANLALLTGRINGLSVLDVDSKDGKKGKDSLLALITQHGGLPTTPAQRTWSGGMQYLFAYDPRAAQGAPCYGDDLDGRNDGGYVVIPPSAVNGAEYRWLDGLSLDDVPWAPMPQWLLDRAGAKKADPRWRPVATPATEAVRNLKAGKGRNNALTSIAGTLRRRGLSEEAIYAALAKENEQTANPLPDEEVQSIAHSVASRYEPAPEDEAVGNLVDGVLERVLADGEAENVVWLWPHYIPVGMLTLLAGDPSQGKSTLTLDLVARITTGKAWPDGAPGGEASDVALLASEDSITHTVLPRLLAAGGDPSRVRQLTTTIEQGQSRHFSLVRDLAALDAVYERRPFAALVVDPINAYLPSVDTYRDNEVRAVLTPLVEWATKRMVAVIAIIHMGKNADRSALQRILGSVAFGAAARASYLACRDATQEGRQLFLCSKLNVAPDPPGLAFRFEPRTVPGKGGVPVATSGVAWEPGTVKVSAEDALKALSKTAPQARQEAMKAIRSVMAGGPVEADEAEAQVLGVGVSEGTLKRAKLDMGVRSVRVGGMADAGRWYWVPLDWTAEQISRFKTQMFAEAVAETKKRTPSD